MPNKQALQNPFPGLRPFQSDEEHLFFGRENQTLELLQILRDNRFVGVIGTSGSGKSSLVRCGLLSELYGGSFLDAGTDWEVAVMNPGGGPFNQLSKALVNADIYDSEEDDIHLKLNATLRRSRLGLVETIRQADMPEGTNFLLVVDQFEEIFRYSEAGEEEGEAADDFIAMLLEAAKQTSVPIYVIITMRSDYIGDCSKFEGLPEEINEGEYLIPRLTREEYKSVIEGPIKVGGGKLAPRLLQRLLNDIGTEADQLPCLQHALMRTWDAWVDREDAEELDLEDYRAIGGMSKALSIHADEIFGTFQKASTKDTATKMFRAITEKGDDNRGIRRPLRLQQLADITNKSLDDVKRVIEPYRQPGVTFIMPPSNRELEANTIVDISHESLMRVWQRLRNWVEEEAQSARVYRRLVDTSSLWKKGEAGLYHDPDLQIAQSWRDQYEPNKAWADLYGGGFEGATEFLEASEEEGRKAEREKELARQRELQQAKELADARARSARNMKRFAAVVGVVAIIALAAMGFAVKAQKAAELAQNEANKARESAEIAEENVKKEFARSDNSLGNSFADSNPRLALAHFSRSLEVEPNNPHAVDRSFNILAYQAPPLSHYSDLPLNPNQFITSTSNATGQLLATTERGSKHKLCVWNALQKDPLIEISLSNGNNFWYQGIDFNKQGNLLAVGYNESNDSQILRINEDNSYEIQCYILRGHIGSVKFSSDGSKLLTSSWKQKITDIWDTKTGDSIFSIESGSWYPKWSPDEKSILLGRHQGRAAAVVDIESGNINEFTHEEIIWHNASFDRSGDKILTIGKPTPTETTQNYYIWDVNSKKIDAKLVHDNVLLAETVIKHSYEHNNGNGLGTNYAVGGFSPDSQIVITAATDQNIRLWDASNGNLLDSLKIPKLPARDQNPIFSVDGNRMILPLRDGTCYLFAFDKKYSKIPPLGDSVSLAKAYNYLKNDGALKGITYPLSNVISAHLNKDCNLILFGTENGKAALFDASSGEQVDTTFYHPGKIHEIATSIDGTKFATASDLGTIKVWELGSTKPIIEIGEPNYETKNEKTKIHFSPDGNLLWIHTLDGSTKLDILSGETDYYATSLSSNLAEVSANGEFYATINNQVVTLRNDTEVTFSASTGTPITSIDISNDSTLISTGLSNGELKIWDINSKTPMIFKTSSGVSILSTNISQDKNYVAAADSSGKLHVFKISPDSKNAILVREGDMACTCVKFNAKGNMIAAVFNDGTKGHSQVWNVENGAAVTPKFTNGSPITNIEFTDNGNSIIVWSSNKQYPNINGLSTKWNILISDGLSSTAHFDDLISQLGGLKLDDNSTPIRVNPENLNDYFSDNLNSDIKSDTFLKWQISHPSNRLQSPFRQNLSQDYLNKLIESNSISLLSEAIRINPENKIALLKRAILKISKSTSRGDSMYIQGYSDLKRAELLNSNDDMAEWLFAMVNELLGNSKAAQKIYKEISSSEKISLAQLSNFIHLHEVTSAPSNNTILLIDKAIELSINKSDQLLEKKFVLMKFILSCSDENYKLSSELWSKIGNWPRIPEGYDPKALFSSFLKTVEFEAFKLLGEGNREDAINILTPSAIASLAQNPGQISSTLTSLFEIFSGDNSSTELIRSNSEWLYLDDGTDQGTEWKQPWFITEGWSKGIAKLGYGGDGETTELSWGANRNNKNRTYYFRHQFNVDEKQKYPFLLANVVRDDGVVIYINGKEVIRDNMPEGEITYSTYASVIAGESLGDEINEHQFQISGDYIDIGTNVIAAEVHQKNNSSSDLGFQLSLTGSNQTPISLLSDFLISDKTNSLLEAAVSIFPQEEREIKKDLIEKLITSYKLNLACETDDYQNVKNLWNEMSEWQEWPDGIDKIELTNKFIKSTNKYAQSLYSAGKTEEATKLLMPVAFSTLVNEDTGIDNSFHILFKWSHPEINTATILPENTSWKYLDDGSDLGTKWKDVGFNDENWKTGQAKLGYGNDGEATVLAYGDDDENKHITYYFRKQFNYDGNSLPKILTANLVRDDGAIVYLNGKEIIRSNMQKGDIKFDTLASGHASGSDESNAQSFNLNPDLLIEGDNLIAAEIHQDDKTSSDIGFSLTLEGKDATIENFIYECIKNESFKQHIEESFNYLTSDEVNNAKQAFRYALSEDINIENESTNFKTIQMTLRILGKMNRFEIIDKLSKLKITNNTESEKKINYQSISEQKEAYHTMAMSMKSNGAMEESLKYLRSMILKAPPRDSNLPDNLIDLTNYYNASIFHYGGFHGGAENQDLRFLPDKYDNNTNIPFDIRGVIRLNSGPIGNWSSANDHWGTRTIGQSYPDAVTGISVNAKAERLHFLMGAVFAANWTDTDTAATLKIHFEDGSSDELKVIAEKDLVDWWAPNKSYLIDPEKIGFIGTNFLGHSRILTKPIWENPHPDRTISHIDFVSGLASGCPILIAITIE